MTHNTPADLQEQNHDYTGEVIEARWSAGAAGTYRGQAEVLGLNPTTARVRLIETVQSNVGGPGYPKGHRMTLPRTPEHKQWSPTQGIFEWDNPTRDTPMFSRWGTYYAHEEQAGITTVMLETGTYEVPDTIANIKDYLARITEQMGPAEQDATTEQVLIEMTKDSARCVKGPFAPMHETPQWRFNKRQEPMRAERYVTEANASGLADALERFAKLRKTEKAMRDQLRSKKTKLVTQVDKASDPDAMTAKVSPELKRISVAHNTSVTKEFKAWDALTKQIATAMPKEARGLRGANPSEDSIAELRTLLSRTAESTEPMRAERDSIIQSNIRKSLTEAATHDPTLLKEMTQAGVFKYGRDLTTSINEIKGGFVQTGTAQRAIEDVTYGQPITKEKAWAQVQRKYKSVKQGEFDDAWEDMKVSGMSRSGIVRRSGNRYEYQDLSKYDESETKMKFSQALSEVTTPKKGDPRALIRVQFNDMGEYRAGVKALKAAASKYKYTLITDPAQTPNGAPLQRFTVMVTFPATKSDPAMKLVDKVLQQAGLDITESIDTVSITEAEDVTTMLAGKAPKDYSKSDQRKVVAMLAKLPLKTLRRRQTMAQAQIKMAYAKRADDALANLQMMDNLIRAAIDKREFGESIHEAGGYTIKAGDKKAIMAFVAGKTTKPGPNLEIAGDTLKQTSMGSKVIATRDKQGFVTPGDATGNISQTWVNAVKRAAKQKGSLRESVINEAAGRVRVQKNKGTAGLIVSIYVGEGGSARAMQAKILNALDQAGFTRERQNGASHIDSDDKIGHLQLTGVVMKKPGSSFSSHIGGKYNDVVKAIKSVFPKTERSTVPIMYQHDPAKTIPISKLSESLLRESGPMTNANLPPRLMSAHAVSMNGTAKAKTLQKLNGKAVEVAWDVKEGIDEAKKTPEQLRFAKKLSAFVRKNQAKFNHHSAGWGGGTASVSFKDSKDADKFEAWAKKQYPDSTVTRTVKKFASGDIHGVNVFAPGINEAGNPQQVAKTILAQLGGNKFIVMTGAKKMASGEIEGEPYLKMNIGRNAKSVNVVMIYLQGSDTYKMEFVSSRGMSWKVKATETNVYADQLRKMFTKNTGMETSLGTMGHKQEGTEMKFSDALHTVNEAKKLRPGTRITFRWASGGTGTGTVDYDDGASTLDVKVSKAGKGVKKGEVTSISRRDIVETLDEALLYDKIGHAILTAVGKAKTMTHKDAIDAAKKAVPDVADADVFSVLSGLKSNGAVLWNPKGKTVAMGPRLKKVKARIEKWINEAELGKAGKSTMKPQMVEVTCKDEPEMLKVLRALAGTGYVAAVMPKATNTVQVHYLSRVSEAGALRGLQMALKKEGVKINESQISEVNTFDYEAEGRKAVKGIAGKVTYSSAARAVMVKLDKPAGKITTVMVMPSSTGQHDINYRSSDNRQWPKLRQQGITTKWVKDAIEQTLEKQAKNESMDEANRKGKTRSGKKRALFLPESVDPDCAEMLAFMEDATLSADLTGNVTLIHTDKPAHTRALLREHGWNVDEGVWHHAEYIATIKEADGTPGLFGAIVLDEARATELFLTARQSVFEIAKGTDLADLSADQIRERAEKLRTATRELREAALFAHHPDAAVYSTLGSKTIATKQVTESQLDEASFGKYKGGHSRSNKAPITTPKKETSKLFTTIMDKGKRLGTVMGNAYFEYEGNIYSLNRGNATNHGPVGQAKTKLNKGILKALKLDEGKYVKMGDLKPVKPGSKVLGSPFDKGDVKGSKPVKSEGKFSVWARDTAGMPGQQDKFLMVYDGKSVGSHPSAEGAMKFGKSNGLIETTVLTEPTTQAVAGAALAVFNQVANNPSSSVEERLTADDNTVILSFLRGATSGKSPRFEIKKDYLFDLKSLEKEPYEEPVAKRSSPKDINVSNLPSGRVIFQHAKRFPALNVTRFNGESLLKNHD